MSTQQKFASKKLLFTIIAMVFLIAIVLIISQINKEEEEPVEEVYTFEQLVDADADGDGVSDWKELLLGTNPLEVDTNNDGLDDGRLSDTISFVYNSQELVRLQEEYPDATEDELLAIIQAERGVDDSNITLSEQVGREVYVAGTILKSLGKLTPELEQDMNEKYIIENITDYPYPIHKITDFDVQEEYDILKNVQYIEAVMTTIADNFFNPDPLNVLENSIERGEDEELLVKGLESNVTRMLSIIETLENTTVPTVFLEEHNALTNAIIRVLVDTSEIRNFYQDSLRGYNAVLRYQPNLLAYRDLVNNIGEIFNNTLQDLQNSLQN